MTESQFLKILGQNTRLPKVVDDEFAGRVVVSEGSRHQFLSLNQMLFRSQKPIHQVANGQPTATTPRCPTRLQVIPLSQILFQGRISVVPGAEIMQLSSNLLGLPTGGVREQWKVHVRFFRFDAFGCHVRAPRKAGVILGVRHIFSVEADLSKLFY